MLNCCTMPRTIFSCWRSFLPKTATSGCTRLKSLSTTVHTPSKNPGRNAPSSSSRAAAAARGRPAASDTSPARRARTARRRLRLLESGAVGLERARIAVEVLVRSELQPVDEDARDDGVAVLRAMLHQRQVARVQVAHRRHERDALSGPALGELLGSRAISIVFSESGPSLALAMRHGFTTAHSRLTEVEELAPRAHAGDARDSTRGARGCRRNSNARC